MIEFIPPPNRCTCAPGPCAACLDYAPHQTPRRQGRQGRASPAALLQYHRRRLAEELATFKRLSQAIAARRQQGLPVSPALRQDRERVRTSLVRRKRRMAALQAGKGTP
jgi:hypothetical protein